MLFLEENSTILFMGDSITDAGRSRDDDRLLGSGYANLVAGQLLASYSDLDLTIYNRGISGHRVKDLQARWQEDCLDLEPDVLSILIGINDVWRRYDSNDPTSVEEFAAGYRDLLQQVRDNLCSQIIMMEPFVLPCPEDRNQWREDLDPKIHAIRELAREFADVYIPLDGIFASACCESEPAYWAGDGVHPSLAGHTLMANAWLEYAGL